MKNNQELVLDLLRQCTGTVALEHAPGVTTQYLSKRLNMQRSNISAILNALVKEGLADKDSRRPVHYWIKSDRDTVTDPSCFAQVIGHGRSLKRAVQLAKAAILYPQHSLHALLSGPSGSGKSYFGELMYQFAVDHGVLVQGKPFVKFNCAHFSDDPRQMYLKLFGSEESEDKGYIETAEDGILFVNHVELLPPDARSKLFQLVENNYLATGHGKRNLNTTVICVLDSVSASQSADIYRSRFAIDICLPSLEERPLEERFLLIKMFFTKEAQRSSKTISITSEILRALLLYPCSGNVKQLKNDIKIACANSYAREYLNQNEHIKLTMSDFPYVVRTGLLNYKYKKADVNHLISENTNYVFTKEQDVTTEKTTPSHSRGSSIYEWIESKSEELRQRGIDQEDINMIVSIDIESEFNRYSSNLVSRIVNKEQLSQLVSSQIIDMVTDFLDDASRVFHRIFPVSVFYGLCLHLNASLQGKEKKQSLPNVRIMEIVEKYRDEYSFSAKFVNQLEDAFQTNLPIDEVVFVTMFICERIIREEGSEQPVILVAMHGNSTASSLAQTVQALSRIPVRFYDMSLDKKAHESYQELKEMIVGANRGKGILAFYDMGSLKQIFEMVEIETGIPIRAIEIPLTAMLLDCCRRVMLESDLDTVYQDIMQRYQGISLFQGTEYWSEKPGKAIITLCMSGEGGAIQLKHYLEKHLEPEEVNIFALAFSDKKALLAEINCIHEKNKILCVIGSYNPELLGIPFIPMEQIFNSTPKELKALTGGRREMEMEFEENSSIIFQQLEEELKHVDTRQLKNMVISLLNELESRYETEFDMEQKIGLLLHISCCIDRLSSGELSPVNPYKSDILERNQKLYQLLKICFVPVEDYFRISLEDDEYACIISIIKKSRRG